MLSVVCNAILQFVSNSTKNIINFKQSIMSFFNKKQKVYLAEFCKEFYDKNFLESVIGGVDVSNSYNELILKNIKEADKNADNIRPINFKNEILILRFELFSLVWFHQFGEKSAIANSIFTKRYLVDKGKEEFWDRAEPYNQAVAASATHGCRSSTASGRARLMIVNKGRMDLFDKYNNENIDAKCVARALNRYGTDERWNMLSITLGYIVIELCKNLNCNLNDEAQFQLVAVLKGFYDGSKQNLENIRIVGE